MLEFHLIIPARFASTRLPQKMLRKLKDRTLIEHTYLNALNAGAASTTIATDHEDIATVAKSMNAPVLMTDASHLTGTDRLAEAVDLLGLPDDAIVVNLQGDEPLMPNSLLQQVAENLANASWAAIATLAEPIADSHDIFNPSIVKVVRDIHRKALYFSRAPIPWDREAFATVPSSASTGYLRHLGVYAYRAGFLRAYRDLAPAPPEQLEKLEQLRALYYGYAIHVDLANAYCPPGIDTEEDLRHVQELLV